MGCYSILAAVLSETSLQKISCAYVVNIPTHPKLPESLGTSGVRGQMDNDVRLGPFYSPRDRVEILDVSYNRLFNLVLGKLVGGACCKVIEDPNLILLSLC